jgi:hypothetical protein
MNAANTRPLEQLRAYIRELKPETRDLLLAEFERAALRGDNIPGASFILQELRNEVRGISVKLQRIGNPQRLFFTPVEPFLVSDTAESENCARIPRACLDPIWHWITRDLIPADAEAYCDDVSRALLAKDQAEAERRGRVFQDRAVEPIHAALAQADESDRARRRLLAQLGPAKGFKHVRQVADVLKGRDKLSFLAGKLPHDIKDLTEPQLAV